MSSTLYTDHIQPLMVVAFSKEDRLCIYPILHVLHIYLLFRDQTLFV